MKKRYFVISTKGKPTVSKKILDNLKMGQTFRRTNCRHRLGELRTLILRGDYERQAIGTVRVENIKKTEDKGVIEVTIRLIEVSHLIIR